MKMFLFFCFQSATKVFPMTKCVAYLRKSTKDKQANSLQTQKREIEIYAKKNDIEIIEWFEESISGTIKTRPVFTQAIKTAKKNKCAMIAKSLSRIGRNASQVLQVIEDVELVITDIGQNIDTNMLGMMAIVNQMEVKALQNRTRQSLAYLRDVKGVKLGNPNIREVQKESIKSIVNNADTYALSMEPIVMNDKSSRDLAGFLNDVGLKTRRGKEWSHTQVQRLRRRIKVLRSA